MNKLQLSGNSVVSGAPALGVTLTAGSVFSASVSPKVFPIPQTQTSWVVIPLPLCAGNVISGITVSYFTSNARSSIYDIFLGTVEQAGSLYVNYARQGTLHSTTPQTVAMTVSPSVTVTTAIGLWFELSFANAADSITITTVEIDYQ